MQLGLTRVGTHACRGVVVVCVFGGGGHIDDILNLMYCSQVHSSLVLIAEFSLCGKFRVPVTTDSSRIAFLLQHKQLLLRGFSLEI